MPQSSLQKFLKVANKLKCYGLDDKMFQRTTLNKIEEELVTTNEVSWHVIERTQSFNPITLQCKLCLSEIVNMLLLNPTQASLNKKSECYQFCRHRKKFLLAYSKPLALKGGALTYRYKR